MINKSNIFLFFILLINLNKIYSYSEQENQCLVNLLTKLDVISEFPLTLDGGTKIDFCKYNFTCSNGDGNNMPYFGVNGMSLRQPSTSLSVMDENDLSCLSVSLNEVYLKEWKLSKNFFEFSKNTFVQTFVEINSNIASIGYLTITLREKMETPIFLSYIKSTYLTVIPSSENGDYYATLLNDLPMNTITQINEITVIVQSFPQMGNVKANGIYFFLGSPFDLNSYENLKTYSNINKVSIRDYAINQFEKSYPFVIDAHFMGPSDPSSYYKFSTLETNYLISKPIDYIDLINSTDPIYMQLIDVGPDFNINGQIPFKNFQKNLIDFYFSGGNLSSVPIFDSNYPNNLRIITLVNNNIGSTLPTPYNRKRILSINLSHNNITGIIDDSYCNVLLDVSFNKMSGQLPLCYECNLRNPDFRNYFINGENNFTNIDNVNTNCKIIPNMKIYDTDKLYPKFVLFGLNLGYGISSGVTYGISFDPPISYISFEQQNSFAILYYYYYVRTIHQVTFSNSPNQIFYLTPDPYKPIPHNVTVSGNVLTINGLYFSYNSSIISITMNNGEKQCTVTGDPTFHQIVCTLANGFPTNIDLNNVSAILKVDELSSLFYINLGDSVINQYKGCLDYCGGNNGECDFTRGICICNEGWSGENCTTPIHSVSSVIASSVDGGLVILNGWFGNVHLDLEIKIGSLNCVQPTINSTTIECLIGPGNGIKNISVVQNGILWIGINKYLYIDNTITLKCLNDCTNLNQGKCNNGQCICKSYWTGIDCSSPKKSNTSTSNDKDDSDTPIIIPPTNSTINNDGTTIISNQQINFEIQIIKLLEIDINGNTIIEYQLESRWLINDTREKLNSIYQFTQTLQNTNCNLTLTIEQVSIDKQYNFAGVDIAIESGSIKVTIEITNYNYKSNLNTLQLQLKSLVSSDTLTKETKCNEVPTEISTELESTSLLNYITISKNNKKLFGRFINRVLSDQVPTIITSSLISNQVDNAGSSNDNQSIIIGLNLPHFRNSLILDPDFSVLISNNFKSSCSDSGKNETSKKSYIIPVSVIVSVLGTASIICGVFYFIKKRDEIKLKRKLNVRLNGIN